MSTQISLEQWVAFIAVVKQGGYAQAAESLEKSQSTISYAVQKIESSLAVRLFKLQGRRAVLTPAGELLYQQATRLVTSAQALESTAHQLSNHWQSQINIAVDAVLPDSILFPALTYFSKDNPLTRVNLIETVLSGSTEALHKREVSLAITANLPAGYTADPLFHVQFLAVAAPHHPLHLLKRELSYSDLQQERQLVVRDSGRKNIDAGWLGAEQRWVFSHLSTSISAAVQGLGFAWYPVEKIKNELKTGQLKPLPLTTGQERFATLYLIYADHEFASLSDKLLGQSFQQAAQALTKQLEQEARAE